MKKTEIIQALRKQHDDLLAKRARLDEQIQQAEAALAAFGTRPRSRTVPTPSSTPRRSRVSIPEMADRVFEVLTREDRMLTVTEIAEALDTGEPQVYRAADELVRQGRVITGERPGANGRARRTYRRAQARLQVTT